MGEPPAERILILAAEQAAAERLAAMLAATGWEIWVDRKGMAQQPPTIVISDGAAANAAETAAWEAGVIRLGTDEAATIGPAEVQLPADVTARELQLTCQLLGQIVRLRRQYRCGVELRRHLVQQALTDPLTGLPNRRAWDHALEQRLTTSRPAERLCLAILDLDFFKRINDTYGHLAGDQVLQRCARALSHGLRQDDFVARLGGDEFGLLLWVPDEPTAAAVVERVRTRVSPAPQAGVQPLEEPAALATTCPVTASAGYCLLPEPSSRPPLPSPAALLAAADAALCEAKRCGRDRTLPWRGNEE